MVKLVNGILNIIGSKFYPHKKRLMLKIQRNKSNKYKYIEQKN